MQLLSNSDDELNDKNYKKRLDEVILQYFITLLYYAYEDLTRRDKYDTQKIVEIVEIKLICHI